MRAIYKMAVGALIVSSMTVIACSGTGDDTGADESNVKADPKVKKIKAATAKLNGAWRPEAEGNLLALVLSANDFGDGPTLSAQRDTKHTKQFAADRNEADRDFVDGKVTTVESDTTGTLEITAQTFTDNTQIKTIEKYRYELKSAGGKETLTLTETEETSTESKFDADENAKPPVPKQNKVRPPFTVARADSWCVLAQDSLAVNDCQSQFGGTWKPKDTPAKCKDKEFNCMRCETDHTCKMHEVSSCELDGKTCFSTVAACEFQDGQPAGQVSRIDQAGKTIDCAGSPTRSSGICCENIFPGRGGEEFGD
jgi:hypothetical protein